MSYRGRKHGSGYAEASRGVRSFHESRSDRAKRIDESLRAPFAKTTEQWLQQPNRYDIPEVDAPKKETKAKSMRVSEGCFWKNADGFERLIDKDYIEEKNAANEKVVMQILKTLDENYIPYYYGGEDTGVQVMKTEAKKAEKLTNALYAALKKTL